MKSRLIVLALLAAAGLTACGPDYHHRHHHHHYYSMTQPANAIAVQVKR